MNKWAHMPAGWLRDGKGLHAFRWGAGAGSEIAALMLYIVLVHHANKDPQTDRSEIGTARLTYDQLQKIASLSRAKVAEGLALLEARQLIEPIEKRDGNLYRIVGYNAERDYAKLPARGLYSRNMEYVLAFKDFTKRSRDELHALKLYLLLVQARDRARGYAQISYEKIYAYTNIPTNDIKKAQSLLISQGLVTVERMFTGSLPSENSNLYHIQHLGEGRRPVEDQIEAVAFRRSSSEKSDIF